MKDIILWVIGIILSVVVQYFVEKWLRPLIEKWRRYIISIGVAVIFFVVFAYFVFPYVQDVFKAVVSSPTDQRCFFDSEIYSPAGASDETTASLERYEFSLNTKVSWEPNDCVMVVQAYQGNTMLAEFKDQETDEVTIQQVTEGRTGVVEIKIFRKGFKTSTSNVWITVLP